jgi:HEAT repeat protein
VTVLQGLWVSSVVMAAGALLWMAGLVSARLGRETRARRRQSEQRAVMKAFMAILGGAGDATAQLSPYQRRACLIAEALLETMALVRGPDRQRLIKALEALSIDSRLRSRLFTHDAPGRIASAEALSVFPSRATVAALESVWRRSRDPALRLAAIRSLIELGEAPTLRDVLRELERAGADSLTFLPVLRRLAMDRPAAAIEEIANPDRSLAVRAMLADALGATGDYAVLPALTHALGDPALEVRTAAIRALGALAHPAAEAGLAQALHDPRWEVRATACEAIGRIGAVNQIPRLIELLQDPAWWVRFRASDAMAQLGDKGVRSLRLAATAPIDVIRRAASLALAERGLA